MHYYESMQSLIGKTPLVKLTHVGLPEGVNLFAKLERTLEPVGQREGPYRSLHGKRRAH